MSQWSIAINAPRRESRGRLEKALLIIGDEHVRGLVDKAHYRPGWAVESFHPSGAFSSVRRRHELVVDTASLADVRLNHPEILQQAQRVWVVPDEGVDSARTTNPFENPLPALGRLVKRSLDILLAITSLVVALPVLLIAIVAVRLDTRGPAVFRQVRMGANGRRFQLYKLRTMSPGGDDRPHREYMAELIAGIGTRCDGVYKLAYDPRITRVGRVLRRFSVDELPQLWNVLKGDMSLVGPRPPLPSEVELYSAKAWGRLRVKPGITGLWQVSGRCELSFEEMVSLDIRYWQRWSLLVDLRILLMTPGTVLSGRGAA